MGTSLQFIAQESANQGYRLNVVLMNMKCHIFSNIGVY